MAEAVNLGTYHDLFFKLGGTDKTADEFAALTDQKEIDRIKEVYASWVAKYINVDEKIRRKKVCPTMSKPKTNTLPRRKKKSPIPRKGKKLQSARI